MGQEFTDYNYTEEEIMTVLSEKLNRRHVLLYGLDFDTLKSAVILLLNRLRTGIRFNSNIIICADDPDISDQCGEVIAETVENWFEDSFGRVSERDLYNRSNWKSAYKYLKVLLVEGYTAASPTNLYETLCDIEKEGWAPAVILCTNSGSINKIKEYEDQDYRLYHYLCGYKVIFPAFDESNIAEIAVSRLEQEGYELTEGFCEKLGIYVKAVYPEARLTKREFLDDLIYRIYHLHYQKIITGMKLDETDVPYSEKADKLEGQLADQNTKSDRNSVSQSGHSEGSLDGMNSMLSGNGSDERQGSPSKRNKDGSMDMPAIKVPALKPMQTHFSSSDDSKNVLILSMSTLPPQGAHYCFIEKGGEVTCQIFSGLSQLEPGTKLFISKLALEGIRADRIIVLTTKETWEPDQKHDGKSAISVYADHVKTFIEGKEKPDERCATAIKAKMEKDIGITPRLFSSKDQIKALYNPDRTISQSTGNTDLDELNHYVEVQTINLDDAPLQELMLTLNNLAADKHVNLYLDLQGGSRSFMFTLFAAITLLRDKNVTIKDLFAIRYDRNFSIHPIEILNNEYAIIDLVSGIRAFSGYGKVDELKNFLASREIAEGDEKNLVEIMEHIDEYMQVNNPEGLTGELEKLAQDDMAVLNPERYTDQQFKLIVEDLRTAYSTLIKPGHTVLDQIGWFGEKAFITSALTFIEDKIPELLLNNNENPVLDVTYDPDLTDEAICKKSGGQSYYKRENNIFNFGLNSIFRNAMDDFYKDLCDYWAGKIVDLSTRRTCNLKLEKVLGQKQFSAKISDSNDLRDCMLEIENSLGNKVWNPVKIERIWKLATKQKIEWGEFKKKYNINKGKDSKVEECGITRNQLLHMFENENGPDSEKQDKARILLLSDYLKNNSFVFYNSNQNHKILLKAVIGTALYKVIMEPGNNGDFVDIINDILKPCLMDLIDCLKTVTVSWEEDTQTSGNEKKGHIVYSGNYSQERFIFELWEQLLVYMGDVQSMASLDALTSRYVISEETVSKLESDLKILDRKMKEVPGAKQEELVHYAETYSICRTGKDYLKRDYCTSKYDSRCSYKNVELYVNIKEAYKNLYTRYFILPDNSTSGFMRTVAGLRGGEYDWLTLHMEGMSEEYRGLLDTCIQFYQAFKSERNATNHAEEIGSNHMDYKCTRKGIAVFVELYKRLLNMKPSASMCI